MVTQGFDPNVIVPPANILVGSLNLDDSCIDKLLQFYLPYVRAASSIPIVNEYGHRDGTFICDDLVQEMLMKIVHVVKVLHNKFMIEQYETDKYHTV